jgi:hypothetical protein
MKALDHLLPQWQFEEVHHIASRANAQALLAAAERHDPQHDRLIGVAMALREAPGRLAAALGLHSALAGRPRFGRADFLPLGPPSADAWALGLVGRFWEAGYGLVRLPDAAAFTAYAEPGVAKLMLGFVAQPLAGGSTRLSTVTRVFCPDAAARRRFAPYWALIRPVSGLIRRRMLGQIRDAAEHADAGGAGGMGSAGQAGGGLNAPG